MGRGPLEGLLVVAIEQAVAAPYCTSRLADAGARVIKVERAAGDFARGYDKAAAGEASYFVWLNRGKESICLDLGAEADRDLLLAMTDRADVMVQNLKPGALARKGLAPGDLRARNPRLVTCSISGYGESGPFADRKAYDMLIQAESGLASVTGGPEAPARVGISVVDIATGATAHAAILEALIARGVTGTGADIHLSMFDAIADWLAVPFLHAAAGNPPARVGLAHPSISPYGVFDTADGGQVLLAVQNDREWAVLAERIMDRPDLAADARCATAHARVVNRDFVMDVVGQVVGRLSAEEAIVRLAAAGIAFARVNDMTDLIAHPHLTTATISTPAGAEVALPAPAPVIDGARRMTRAAAPALDAHGAAIRAEFGDT